MQEQLPDGRERPACPPSMAAKKNRAGRRGNLFQDPMVRTGKLRPIACATGRVEHQCTSKFCSLTGSVVEFVQALLPVASEPVVRFAGGVTLAVFE